MTRFAVGNSTKSTKTGWALSKFWIFFNALLCLQCSLLPTPKHSKASIKATISPHTEKYSYKDSFGEYFLTKHVRFKKTKLGPTLAIKNNLYDESTQKKVVVEQMHSYAHPGKLKVQNTYAPMLRPYASFTKMWLEKQEYATQMVFNLKKKSLDIYNQDPSGRKNYSLRVPADGTGVFCFYSQLMECLQYSGFFTMAMTHKDGKLDFHLIWDGFPYFQKRLGQSSTSPFSKAQFYFDGIDEQTHLYKYVLDVDGQAIFYQIDDKGMLQKQFWVSQGMTQERL